jgi:Methyltransferase domain
MWKKLKPSVKKTYQAFNRTLTTNTALINLPVEPFSNKFGWDRGTPIDRYYIEKFLEYNIYSIQGIVLEIAEDTYARKFGQDVSSFEILFPNDSLENATIIGDLTDAESIPDQKVDCFIATQTYNFIYDFQEAIKNSYKVLKINGVLLATVAGISQISRYDMDRWGDYWRFTSLAMKKSFEHIFGEGNVEIVSYGNAFAATSYLQGMVVEDVDVEKLDAIHQDYECIIGIKALRH